MLNQINLDVKNAMKNKESQKRDLLRLILAKAKDLAKSDKNREVTSEDVKNAIIKQIKQNKETISFSQENGREALREKEEIEILMSYLPKQMNDEEVEKLIENIISEIPEEKRNMKSRGLVMGKLSKYRDVLDMRKAGEIVGKKLNN